MTDLTSPEIIAASYALALVVGGVAGWAAAKAFETWRERRKPPPF